MRLTEVPGFTRFWAAATVSAFGSTITPLAVQLLVLQRLGGGTGAVGLVSAAQWLPYLLFGLLAGVLLDRRRRLPLQLGCDIGSGVVLIAIPMLAYAGLLGLGWLLVAMFGFGLLSLINSVASQSFVPRLVPGPLLPAANARFDQGQAAADTAGPALGGGLVSLLGAANAVLVDAASYFVSALALSRVPVSEPAPAAQSASVRAQVSAGLRWVYGHRLLRVLALGTHAWFACSAVGRVVMIAFAVRALHLSSFEVGLALAIGGVGGLIGSGLALRLGTALGPGRAVIGCHVVTGLAFAVMTTGWAGFGVGQLLLGLSMGAANTNEMGLRQQLTPDGLQGRTAATMRSFNRAMIVIFAPIGGLLGERLGYRWILLAAAMGFAVVAAGMAATSFRTASFAR